MIRNLLMAAIIAYFCWQGILISNAYPLQKYPFAVTGAQCDPYTGVCHQKGGLAKCNNAESCGKKEYALWLKMQDITWIILIPLEGYSQMNAGDQNKYLQNYPDAADNRIKDPLHGKSFTVTGGICKPGGRGCFQKGYLRSCNSAWSCWQEASAILEKYESNITWVVLSPQELP